MALRNIHSLLAVVESATLPLHLIVDHAEFKAGSATSTGIAAGASHSGTGAGMAIGAGAGAGGPYGGSPRGAKAGKGWRKKR